MNHSSSINYSVEVVKRLLLIVALLVPFAGLPQSSVSAATYTGCQSWRSVTNPWTGLVITPGSNQRYANLNSMDLSCVDLNNVDFYGAVLGGVIWSNSNLTNTNFGGTGYCGGIFTGADISGSNLKTTSTWTCASRVDVYVNPVTTTTTGPSTTTTTTTTTSTTTTTVAPVNYYCIKPGGIGIYITWLNSKNMNWGSSLRQTVPGPGVTLITLSEWLSKTDLEKIAMKGEVAVRPIPSQGCSSLDETLAFPTTTSSVSPTTVSPREVPAAPTNTVPPRACAPTADQLFIYSYFYSGTVTNLGGTFDSGIWGWSFDYARNCVVAPLSELLIEDNSGIMAKQSTRSFQWSYDIKVSNCWRIARVSRYGQSEWSNRVCYTAPTPSPLPSISMAPTDLLASIGLTPSSTVPNKTVKIKVPKGARGAQCLDGYRTTVKTSKACRSHYGVDFWLFKSFRAGYSFSYSPSKSYSTAGSGSGKCVGICYGVPSSINGLPRNTYVSGYFRKDGTYVGPYTRSSP